MPHYVHTAKLLLLNSWRSGVRNRRHTTLDLDTWIFPGQVHMRIPHT